VTTQRQYPDYLQPRPPPRIGYDRRMKKGGIGSDWFPYAVAAAAAIVIAVCLWLFGLWADEHAGDSWAHFQASVAKSISHENEHPSRPMPSTTNAPQQTSQP
jgi:hypothetical protein